MDDDDLKTTVEDDSRITLPELAGLFNVGLATISFKRKAIEKTKKLEKLVTHDLIATNRKCRYEICSLLNQNFLFLDRIITCNEKWILYDSPKNCQSGLIKMKHLNTLQSQTFIWIKTRDYSFLKPCGSFPTDKYSAQLDDMHNKLIEWNRY